MIKLESVRGREFIAEEATDIEGALNQFFASRVRDDSLRVKSAKIKNYKFSGVDLSYFRFEGCTFDKCTFDDLKVTGATFEGCTFYNVVFDRGIYDAVVFEDCTFKDTGFVELTLDYCMFDGCKMGVFDLYKCDLVDDVRFDGVDASVFRFEYCTLEGTSIRNVTCRATELNTSTFDKVILAKYKGSTFEVGDCDFVSSKIDLLKMGQVSVENCFFKKSNFKVNGEDVSVGKLTSGYFEVGS